MPDEADGDKVAAEIEKLLKSGDGVLWLTDRKAPPPASPWPRWPTWRWARSSDRRVGFWRAS